MKKKVFTLLAIIALMCTLTSCFHSHDWSGATCKELSRCYECGETQGGYGDHSYQYGKCTICDEIASETMVDLTDTVKSLYGIYWTVTFNKEVKLTHVDDMTVSFTTTDISGNKAIVEGSIIVKAENGKYYTDTFSLHLINNDNDWVRDINYDTSYSQQPIECYASGTISTYHFTQNPTYVYNTYVGKAKSIMSFDDETCAVKIYNYYGYVDSSGTFQYSIQYGVLWDYVILKGATEDISLVKMDNGLIWDDMVFLLD